MQPAASHALVLVPNDGFRRARALTTPANVVIERDGRTLTAAVFPQRDHNLLCVTVIGVEAPPPWNADRHLSRHPPAGIARLRDDQEWIFVLGPVHSDITSFELTLDGTGGDWTVRIPVEVAETQGIVAKPCDIANVHQGVLVKATAVASSPELSAVELDAFCVDAAGDEVRGSKWDWRPVRSVDRLWVDEAILRDDHGRGYRVHPGHGGPPYGGARHRRIAWFEGLPAEVRLAILEIPFVEMREVEQEALDLPLPSEIELEYDGRPARIVVTRVIGHDGPRARVEITSLDPRGDRHLLYFGTARVDGKEVIGMTVARAPGRSPVVEAPDPSGRGERITLSHPVMLIGGPWRLPLTFD